ncbi:MAG: sigma factor-like helix-turn-helix DNA-binding protein [Ruminococcus sp.]
MMWLNCSIVLQKAQKRHYWGWKNRNIYQWHLKACDGKNLINYMIFMRVVMEGVSTEEVAREFGYTRNNVNNRVLRARKWLLAEILRLEKE